MRYFFIVFLLGLPALTTGEPLTPRPLDPIAAQTFANAMSRSAAVRSLVTILERSNVIVHIESSQRMPEGIAGTTRFVTARAGFRYVRITIFSELPATERTAILGHELQHACEIADSGAADVESLRRIFLRDGTRRGSFFETDGAIAVERIVRLELMGRLGTASRYNGSR